MKIFTKFSIVLVVMLVSSFVSNDLLAGNPITLSGSKTELKMNNNTGLQFEIINSVSKFETLNLTTEKGNFVEILADGFGKTNNYGSPELPVITRLIQIPEGAEAEVEILDYVATTYFLSDFGISDKILPAQLPQPKSLDKTMPFQYNEEAYNKDEFYGTDLVKIADEGRLRGARLATLYIAPVQYNPVQNAIKVYDHLKIRVTFRNGDMSATKDILNKYASPYFSSVYNSAINSAAFDSPADTMAKMPVKYVIVSDPMFHDALQPFKNWKIRKGFTVIDAYTSQCEVGTTKESIKAYLQGLYTSATPESPAPTFVLFVGDIAQIPAWDCNDGHVSDLYYCEYSGDYLPEVYFGRFSASNLTQLNAYIDKTMEYEQYLMPDPSFLGEVCMIAGHDPTNGPLYGNGQINYGTTYYFNAAHGMESHTYLQPEPSGGNYENNIHQNVSDGVAFANYTAHGSSSGWADPEFSISDVANLQNAHKYPLMVGNCCQTSMYDLTCFGEEVVRTPNKGALAYIGASNYSYWDEDYWWGVGVSSIVVNPTYEATGLGSYDRTFHDHGEPRTEWYASADQMIFAGNLAVQASSSGMKQYYWEIYCLMGDPSVMTYFGVPAEMDAEWTPLLPLGQSNFTVTTEPFAYVAISRDNVLHGAVEADENGIANMNITPFFEPGYANIVITAQNHQPVIDSVLVASPEGPYLLVGQYFVSDVQGNNNQIYEYNEPLTVDVTVNNYGNTDAVNAVSTLTSASNYVTIPQNTYTWSMIPSQGNASALDAFLIHVNNYVPDQHIAHFTLTTVANGTTFSSQFSILLNSPKIVAGNFAVDDATGGNGDGRIDPGETISVTIPITNNGHCSTSAITAQLISIGNYITIQNQNLTFPALSVGEGASATFTFDVSTDIPEGSSLQLYFVASAGPYAGTSSFLPLIGEQVEDFETGNLLKYPWQTNGNAVWKVDQTYKYEGSYSAKSGTIGNGQSSKLFLDCYVYADDVISFYRKVSSQNGHDYLKFYIDGVAIDQWSGSKDWDQVSYPIVKGSHRLMWAYEKDATTMSGLDAAWVDYIKLPPMSASPTGPLSVVTVALPETVCAGATSQLFAFATGGNGIYSYEWTPAENLNDNSILNPIAIVNQETDFNVSVTSGMSTMTGMVHVNVNPAPAAPEITLSAGVLHSTPATAYQWYCSSGLIAGATQQDYTPVHTDTYYVIVTDNIGCASSASNQIYVGFAANGQLAKSLNAIALPNPFTNNVKIQFNTVAEGMTSVKIYNSTGECVKELYNGMLTAGNNELNFDASALAPGIYMCNIATDNQSTSVKLIKK